MVAHENALGLTCQYRWAKCSDGAPRVEEHWTNDGERYRFHYDLDNRETTITDALGRIAKIHYNDQRRVVASRDFGGEQYRIELDAAGNMTGLTLPDGNALKLAYDDFSRLIEETDPLGRSNRYTYHLDTDLISAIDRPDGSREGLGRWAYPPLGWHFS